MKKLRRKFLAILMLILTLFSSFQGIVFAQTEISDAYIEYSHDTGHHLQYWNASKGRWSYVITSFVEYEHNGRRYPAYCANRERAGVDSGLEYSVNILDHLNDARIWRVIKNGYPYQTAQAMGVENDDDAFVATKHSVYSILYDIDVRAYYKGGDERGNKIVDAIERLTNEGRYGTETPNSSEIQADKVGEFKQDNINSNYYSQEYKVSAGVNIREYIVNGISGFPEGSYITDMSNNSKTNFYENEHFKILVPKANIKQNYNGKISIIGKCLVYPMFYGHSPDETLQNYILAFDAWGDVNGTGNLNIDAYKSSIKVVKVDAETKNPIEGVEFNFRYADGQNIGNYKTNSQGCIELSKLRQGNVIATEIATKSEYILDDKEREIVLDYNDSKTMTIENEHKRGDLKVYKVDADNNKITLGGVKFALYSYEFNKITGHYTTNANGEISIKNLRTGKWALIEEETNKWYNLLDGQIEIKVEWNETTNTTIENELKKSQVKVIKVDKENHEVKLKDVVFEVLDKNNNVLETIKTNSEGEAVTSRYAVRDYSELYIREKITNKKYVLDDTIHKIELKENEIVTQTFENKKIKGQIKVIKTSEGDSKITGMKDGEPMANVSFDVYDENKNYVETIKTSEEGIATTSLLEKGTYFVKESEKDSPEWYLLNTKEYSAEIVNDGDIITLEITNIPENPDVDIEKDGIIQTTANQEIKYNFNIKNTGNTPLDKFTWTDILPSEYVTATRLITGTYNQDLNYAIYYKTNKNDYRLLKDNLNTQVNNYISFTDLQLEDDEYVTEFKVDFGTVGVGFESVEKPQLFVNVKSIVKNDDVFTNRTRIEGYNKTYLVWDEDDHTTKVYEKKIEVKLPRTGC